MTSRLRFFLFLAVTALLLPACSGGSSSSPPTSSPMVSSAVSSTEPPGTPRVLDAGVHDATVRTADGRERTYRIYVPKSARSGTPVPLVLGLHGGTGSGRQFERSSGIDALADERGFVVVYPDGIGSRLADDQLRTWNAGLCCGNAVVQRVDDVAFLRAVVESVERDHPIDPKRVFVVGHSNGAMMGYRLACEMSDLVAAVAAQAGNLGVDSCAPSHAVSFLHLHGADDASVPIEGGKGEGLAGVSYPSVASGLATLTGVNGCAPVATRDTAAVGVTIDTWSGCRDGAVIAYELVAGATHTWMRAPVPVDASRTAIDFVLAHGRR